jgi:DNA polymerase V
MEDNIRTDRGLFGVTEDHLEASLSLDRRFIKNPLSTFFFTMDGESMSPLINAGDILIVDKASRPVAGNIVILSYQGELFCRKFLMKEGHWIFNAINPRFKSIVVRPNDESDCEMWGVVRSMVRDFTFV